MSSSGPMTPNSRSISRSGATPNRAAKRGSNCSPVSAPVSSPASRSRAVGSSPAKRSRTASEGRPSAAQNAWKEANTSVVSTPPQSTSSPRSSATRYRQGALGQQRHAVLEHVEERVLGRAGQPALVGALEEHGRLPQRERRVPAQVGHRASRLCLVAADQLLPPGEAALARHAAE